MERSRESFECNCAMWGVCWQSGRNTAEEVQQTDEQVVQREEKKGSLGVSAVMRVYQSQLPEGAQLLPPPHRRLLHHLLIDTQQPRGDFSPVVHAQDLLILRRQRAGVGDGVVLHVPDGRADASEQPLLGGTHEEALRRGQQLGHAADVGGDDDAAGAGDEAREQALHEGFEDGDVEGLGEGAGPVDVPTALGENQAKCVTRKGATSSWAISPITSTRRAPHCRFHRSARRWILSCSSPVPPTRKLTIGKEASVRFMTVSNKQTPFR